MVRPLVCAAACAVLLSGCGDDAPSRTTGDGPFRVTMDRVVATLEQVAPAASVSRRPPALARRSLPRPLESASLRTPAGTALDLLVYRYANAALRARASVLAALDRGSSRAVVLQHNLLMVFRARGTDAPLLRSAVEKLGAG